MMQNHPIHNHPIELVPYDPQWPAQFEKEAAQLLPILEDHLVEIHHIGSTSIPGLMAKPLIDMMPVVYDLNKVDGINEEMEAMEYICMGELGIPGRRFFCKSLEKRTHNVHVFQQGDPNVDRHLKFRDVLRQHPELSEEYAQLKMELAKANQDDRRAYTDGKTEFIRRVES